MMTISVEAVYEGGVFRPIRKLALAEGTHVDVLVPQTTAPRNPKAVAARLSQIAARAPRHGQSESTSRNHDRILYGGKEQP
jgi:predicted DNA-binding antitoxin AbrB/MazE fold protein